MENQYFGKVEKRSKSFYFVFLLTLVFFVLMVNSDMAHYSQHLQTGVPSWFITLIFVVDIAILVSIVLIFFYKKIGVFAFPLFVMAHHLLYEFYLSTTLIAGLHLLFVYVSLGLLVVIPRWKSFK